MSRFRGVRPVKILYDSLGFEEPWGGVPRYFAELIRHLPDSYEPLLAVAESPHGTLHASPWKIPVARQCVSDFLPGRSFPGKRRLYLALARLFPRIWPSSELANVRLLDRMLREPFDLVHLTAPHRYGDSWRKFVDRAPLVVTVHDLIPELVYGDRRTRADRQEILSAATAIIAVSEATKNDILSTYDVDVRKLVVVHHGVDRRFFAEESTCGYSEDSAYLLYVGKRGGYKNWSTFVKYSASWVLEHPKRRIVCIGKPFDDAEAQVIAMHGLAGRIEVRSVTDDELQKLYRTAFAFVCPSTHEGFGLPVLEAMSARCPVLLSDIPVFREVAGDAALYFSEADDFRQALSHLDDPVQRESRVEQGVRRAETFTWERCAAETAEVYRGAVAGDLKT